MTSTGEHPDGPDPIRDLVWTGAMDRLAQSAKLSVERDREAEMIDQVDRDLMLMSLGEVLSIFHPTPIDDEKVYHAMVSTKILQQWKMAMTLSMNRPRCEFRGQKIDGEVVRCSRAEHNDARHLMAWG